jgi:hypothetical protein
MNKVKMFLNDDEILPYDHPGLEQTIHCPLCGELMTLLQYKEPKGGPRFVMVSTSIFEYPLACIECKTFYFFKGGPIRLREIPDIWGYRFKDIKRLKWQEQHTKEGKE